MSIDLRDAEFDLIANMTADKEKAEKYAKILYTQAVIIAGLPVEDPSDYADLVCSLMN